MTASKDQIRADMRRVRRMMTPEARQRASASVCAQILTHVGAGPVAVYLATRDELDLTSFVTAALTRGIPLFAPRWNGAAYDLAPLMGLAADSLRAGPRGLLEPAEPAEASADAVCAAIDAWIVPGLAFTKDGRRLGYGGGWYDRLLSAASPAAVKFGVAYPFQVLPDLPSEPHDIRLTGVIIAERTDAPHIVGSSVEARRIWYNTQPTI